MYHETDHFLAWSFHAGEAIQFQDWGRDLTISQSIFVTSFIVALFILRCFTAKEYICNKLLNLEKFLKKYKHTTKLITILAPSLLIAYFTYQANLINANLYKIEYFRSNHPIFSFTKTGEDLITITGFNSKYPVDITSAEAYARIETSLKTETCTKPWCHEKKNRCFLIERFFEEAKMVGYSPEPMFTISSNEGIKLYEKIVNNMRTYRPDIKTVIKYYVIFQYTDHQDNKREKTFCLEGKDKYHICQPTCSLSGNWGMNGSLSRKEFEEYDFKSFLEEVYPLKKTN